MRFQNPFVSPNSSTPTILCASSQSCCISAIQPKPGYKHKILYVKKKQAEHARRFIHVQSLTYLFQDGLSGLISAQHTAKAGQKVLHTHILKAAATVLRYPKIFQAIFPPCLLFTIQLASKSHKTHDAHPDLIFKQKLTSSCFLATKNALLKTCFPLMLLLVIGSVSMVHHCPPSSAAVCPLHHKFLAKGRNLTRKCRKCSKRNCHNFLAPHFLWRSLLVKLQLWLWPSCQAQNEASLPVKLRQQVLPYKLPKLSLLLAAKCEVMARISVQ